MSLISATQQSPREPLAPDAPVALGLLTNLFRRLHAEEIRYCHWKSSEHLDASVQGTTDLDVLVHRNDAGRLARVLADSDFKPFRKLSGHDYPGIEDYLGCDADTAALSHFHVHYQLTLGEKFLKGYWLPWEDTVLATRAWDDEHGLYVIDPHLEALLLVTRAALKLRARDFLLTVAGYPYIRGGLLRELRWLARRVQADRLRAVAGSVVGARATALLHDILSAPAPSIRQLMAFRQSVRPSLSSYRLYGPLEARGRRWMREAGWVWAALVNWFRGLTKRSTRVSKQGGFTACVTGPQPVATQVAERLIDWLAPDMAVLPALGPRSSIQARRARGRGVIVIANRLLDPEEVRPDLIIRLSDPSNGAPGVVRAGATPTIELDVRAGLATALVQAQRAIWERL
jgi:hypothetical protein